jgi:pyridine nucleotide-disulfide oxidoreductase family protein
MKRLVLVGAGHAHAQVLLDFTRAPLPGVELCVVSPGALAPYSGMVPGWLAGHYRFDEICIYFAALGAAAGARLVIDELLTLDPDRRRIGLAGGASLDYDQLSLNVGSTLAPPEVAGTRVLSMRPLGRLHEAWHQALDELVMRAADRPWRITAVGGGAAGIESLLAIRHRLQRLRPDHPVHATLVSRSTGVWAGAAPGAIRSVQRALQVTEVSVQLDTDYDDPMARSADLLLWATGALAHPWQRRCGLAIDSNGFIRVGPDLRSVSHAGVHAVGDCAAWADPLPKAGVYAVRMGPVLSRNLRAALGTGTPVGYQPQRRFLALLATGEQRAIASWGRWSAEGAWVWRWKDRIDRRFVRRFTLPEGPSQRPAEPSREPVSIREDPA